MLMTRTLEEEYYKFTMADGAIVPVSTQQLRDSLKDPSKCDLSSILCSTSDSDPTGRTAMMTGIVGRPPSGSSTTQQSISANLTDPTHPTHPTEPMELTGQPGWTELTEGELAYLCSRIKGLHSISKESTWSADTAPGYSDPTLGPGVVKGTALLNEGVQYYELLFNDGSRLQVRPEWLSRALASIRSGYPTPTLGLDPNRRADTSQNSHQHTGEVILGHGQSAIPHSPTSKSNRTGIPASVTRSPGEGVWPNSYYRTFDQPEDPFESGSVFP
ncbi:hypothetical protein DB88DRAFT_104788 [Papiliotrema laurentii]|uniref:Uncharacterized protein n=1 Tax=Papiliotrema laurentii TaxID=5418 RepID=A0AAD9FJE0_PAPLA|nr:hypothetical protein DB88DRAFT_104788 [Papiliotrema laurentii]